MNNENTNEIMEVINEEVAVAVVEETTNSSTLVKVAKGAGIVGAVATLIYFGYKGFKKIRAKKAENVETENENVEEVTE